MLESGERIEAGLVAANLQAKLLYLKLIDKQWLPAQVIDAVKHMRTESIAFKINLAASALPRWTAYDAQRFGVTPPPGTLMTVTERAYTSPIWYTP